MQPATSAAAASVAPGEAERVEVGYLDGEAYEVRVRGHGYASTSQPPWAAPTAPTPTELFVGPLAACVAFYAGRYLTHHDLHRGGLEVHTDFDMATDRPARVAAIRITVRGEAAIEADVEGARDVPGGEREAPERRTSGRAEPATRHSLTERLRFTSVHASPGTAAALRPLPK